MTPFDQILSRLREPVGPDGRWNQALAEHWIELGCPSLDRNDKEAHPTQRR